MSEIIEYSVCCNAEVNYVKGSYAGQYDTECSRCGMYCKTYKTER